MTVPFRAQTWFITGASGLVGSAIIKKLRENDLSVIALIRSSSPQHVVDWLVLQDTKVIYGDILEPETYQDYLATADVVVHTAAAVQNRDKKTNWDTNFEGTKLLVHAMKSFGVKRLLHISTAGVYGTVKESEIEEAMPVKPYGAYLRSKNAAEIFLLNQEEDLFVTIIRPPFILGDPEFDRHVLPTLLKIGTQRFSISVWRMNPKLGFAHAEDIATLVLLVGSRQTTPSPIYNVQSFEVHLDELIHMVTNAKNIKPLTLQIPYVIIYLLAVILDFIDFIRRNPYGYRKRIRFLRANWIFSTELATEELGWSPMHLEKKELEIQLTEYYDRYIRKIEEENNQQLDDVQAEVDKFKQ